MYKVGSKSETFMVVILLPPQNDKVSKETGVDQLTIALLLLSKGKLLGRVILCTYDPRHHCTKAVNDPLVNMAKIKGAVGMQEIRIEDWVLFHVGRQLKFKRVIIDLMNDPVGANELGSSFRKARFLHAATEVLSAFRRTSLPTSNGVGH